MWEAEIWVFVWNVLVMAELLVGTLCTILVKTHEPEIVKKKKKLQAKHLFTCEI